MSSVRDRQRAAARARLEREMAARAETARRRRLLQARIGAGVVGALLLGAIIWIIAAVGGGDDGGAPVASSPDPGVRTCDWIPQVDPSASPTPELPPGMKDVGRPPTTVPSRGYQVMTIDTNLGVIKVELDLSKTPCAAASFSHLASVQFYDDTPCFRLVPSIFALQCGGESNTAGPTYRFADENLPKNNRPWYRDGDVAMANAGADTNGSQFFFIFGNIDVDGPLQPNYALIGRVIEGMDVIREVAAGGIEGAADAQEGPPKKKLIIKSLTVAEPTDQRAPDPTDAPPSPSQSPTPAPSALPSPTP